MVFMTSGQYKRYLRVIKQLEDCEEIYYDAIKALLLRIHEICVEQGISKRLTKKQRNKISFSFRNRHAIDDETTISVIDIYPPSLTDTFHLEYLPVSWLWRGSSWEAEFIEEWIEPVLLEQEKHKKQIEDDEFEEYERLQKKFKNKT